MLLASKLLLIRQELRCGSRSDTTQWRSLYHILIWHLPYYLALEAIVHPNTEQWGTLFLDSFLSEPSVRREIRLLADLIVSDQTADQIRKTNLSLSEHVDEPFSGKNHTQSLRSRRRGAPEVSKDCPHGGLISRATACVKQLYPMG